MRKFFLSFTAVLCACLLQAQTLVDIGTAKVSVPEFLWVYKKGNGTESLKEKDIRSFLDLYINFRMKVLDAESRGLDNEQAFIDELKGYRTRLSNRYLLEREVRDTLVKEAYQRSLKIINASHILILCAPEAPSADTLTAYQKITSIRDKALSGTPFEELAVAYSEEPGSVESKGYLGDFSVFKMVYPFETAAYQTAKNQISEIARSRFGYHLIKVHDIKANPGQVEVAHILIASPKNSDENADIEAHAKSLEIYKRLIRGADFGLIAKQFSEDKNTSEIGGVLQALAPGQSDKAFEEAAFALEKPGDIASPVKTPFGWHVIKLVSKLPVPSFDQLKTQLRNRVAADFRSVLGQDVLISRLKKQYNFIEDPSIKNKPEVLQEKLSSSEKNGDHVLFSFSNEKVVLADFLKFAALNNTNEQNTAELYNMFVQKKLTDLENHLLEEKYPEFGFLLNEYRNGTLLFNLSEQMIWNLSEADSAKLHGFYKSRPEVYRWKERADAQVYTAGSAAGLKVVREMLSQKKTDQEILALINKSNPLNLVINAGVFERGSHMFVNRAKWQNNTISEINVGNTFALVKINKVMPPSAKSFTEVEGVLLNDYQDHLEKLWLKELKGKYPVRINQTELKKISR